MTAQRDQSFSGAETSVCLNGAPLLLNTFRPALVMTLLYALLTHLRLEGEKRFFAMQLGSKENVPSAALPFSASMDGWVHTSMKHPSCKK